MCNEPCRLVLTLTAGVTFRLSDELVIGADSDVTLLSMGEGATLDWGSTKHGCPKSSGHQK